MYDKNNSVVITSEDTVLMRGKIISISNNDCIIHTDKNEDFDYIAAQYNLKQNNAKLIKKDKSEEKINNLSLSKTVDSKYPDLSNENVYIEQMLPQEGIILVNVDGNLMEVNMPEYNKYMT